ncbi:glycosyltransferase [Salinicola halimionae]|uniref:glycosyltransferase n=1 Tax=Salinicola halimionae TaxID=1949081 RepID=UPI000DA18590|nr:glycosyltransferase [Salinicola halimionae]
MSHINYTQARPSKASIATEITVMLLLATLVLLLVTHLPGEVFHPGSKSFIFAVGLIGAWRYSWWFVQALRSVWYNRRMFPRLRAEADAVGATETPDALYILCTSFRIDTEVTFAVYDALIRDAADYNVPTTLFAAIADRSDVDIIDQVMEEHGWPDNISVRYMFQKGDGKRSAMAEVLRAISRCMPTHRSLLVSMDGDIRIQPGTLERSLSFFLAKDDLGAITTNNNAVVIGNDVTKEWYDLRYAQRHLVMSSTSVSERLLVLTGRYSAFRADIATEPEFIDLVESDHVDHWRFGNFKFLSGDDKSTWFWLLKHRWKMLYIPDVIVTGFEELPERRRFFKSTQDLMRRWFGNMLRTNGRAIALGPSRMGWFTWWSLVDQRLSMWTTLIGPTIAVMLTLFVRPSFIFAYLLWIVMTRGITSLVLAWQRGRWSALWVPMLYYNQLSGAILKTWVSFRFNRQTWSRQGISAGEPDDPRAARRQRLGGHLIHALYFGILVFVLAIFGGIMAPADRLSVAAMVGAQPEAADEDNASDNRWLALTLADAPEDGSIHLPAGDYRLDASFEDDVAALDRIRGASLHGYGDPDHPTRLQIGPGLSTQITSGDTTLASAGRLQCEAQQPCQLQVGGHDIRLTDLSLVLGESHKDEKALAMNRQ